MWSLDRQPTAVPGCAQVGHAGLVRTLDTGREPARPRDPWSLALVAVAVVWVLGSVVNVAYQVGVEGRSAWWLLEVPLSAAVAYLVGVGAWRRLRGGRGPGVGAGRSSAVDHDGRSADRRGESR